MWLQYIGTHQMAPKATLHARHNLAIDGQNTH